MAERQVSFVDTNVLAYAHDRSETRKQPVARARLEALWHIGICDARLPLRGRREVGPSGVASQGAQGGPQGLLLQPEFVTFTVHWLAGGSGRHGRGPGGGGAGRPAQPMAAVAGRPAGHGDEQVLDLVANQRDQPQRWCVAGVLGGRGNYHARVGQHCQGHPAVPGAPAAHLVLVQPQGALI